MKLPPCRHWFRWSGWVLGAALLAMSVGYVRGQAVSNLLPADPNQAWAEMERGYGSVKAPPSWQNKAPRPGEITASQKIIRTSALNYATKAREFIAKFPTNDHVGDARVMVVHFHMNALAAGDANSEAEVNRYLDATIADTTIPEKDRVAVFLMSGNVKIYKDAGMDFFTTGAAAYDEEFDKVDKSQLREARKFFPKSEFVYRYLIGLAQRLEGEERKATLAEVTDAEGAPESMKTLARHLLKGTKPYPVGKPFDLKFTTSEGKPFDLADLKGKVVLINFWSTENGASVADLAMLQDVYSKWHDKGLEIVGISLDDKASSLKKIVREKNLPWPQYFDGKGWANDIAVRCAIFKIPTTWVVDAMGNLRLTNLPANPDRTVQYFLAQRPKE